MWVAARDWHVALSGGHFRHFDSQQLFGASKEQARWYYRLSDRGSDAKLPWSGGKENW